MSLKAALAGSHLLFYASIALYLGAIHPGCGSFLAALLLTAALVELFPRWLKRLGVPGLLLSVITAGFWWSGILERNLHAGSGMIMAYCVLIPSRPGRLKWLLALVFIELVLMARLSSGGLFYMLVLPLGLAALGVDSWLSGSFPVSEPARLRGPDSLFRWAIAPVILVAAIALTAGSWLVEETTAFHARAAVQNAVQSDGPAVSGFEGILVIGNHRAIGRDPRMIANITWESGAPPGDMVYLRVLALPDLVMWGPRISWAALPKPQLHAVAPPSRPPGRWAKLQRLPSVTDAVFRVDGGQAPELDGMLADDDGNLYCPNSRGWVQNYRIDFEGGQVAAEPASLPRCRAVDPLLDTLPWAQIEEPHWRHVSPEYAASLICERLKVRCRYDLENLPVPARGSGNVLRAFLFGSTPAERVGHCQYFATSAVLLLRRAGHAARCVAGYASSEVDGRSLLFRGLHAHAWIEVVNSQGRWQRFDPTPSLRNSRITEGVDLKSATLPGKDQPAPQDALPADDAAPGLSRVLAEAWWWALPLLAITFLAALRLTTYLRHRSRKLNNPRLAELQRRNEDLIQVALSLGIAVKPATTLSDLVAALERRTATPLQHHLAAHLAARFGGGPLPEPWPLAALLKAK